MRIALPRGQTKQTTNEQGPQPSRFLLIYERKPTERAGERCRWREEVFIDSPEQAKAKPRRVLSQFELYQGLRLINTLSEKELITKAE